MKPYKLCFNIFQLTNYLPLCLSYRLPVCISVAYLQAHSLIHSIVSIFMSPTFATPVLLRHLTF